MAEKLPAILPENAKRDHLGKQGLERKHFAMLQKKFRDAKSIALPKDEVFARRDQHSRLSHLFTSGQINHREFGERSVLLSYDVGSIAVDNPQDFRTLLDMVETYTENDREYEYTHELSHFEEAQRIGLKPLFQLHLYIIEDGKVGAWSAVSAKLPDEWTDAQKVDAVQKVAAAPDNLSQSDREILGLPDAKREQVVVKLPTTDITEVNE